MYSVKQSYLVFIIAQSLFTLGTACGVGDTTATEGTETGSESKSEAPDVGDEETGEATKPMTESASTSEADSTTNQETAEAGDSSSTESEDESSSDSVSSTESTDLEDNSGDSTQSSEEDASASSSEDGTSESETTGTDTMTSEESESVGTSESDTGDSSTEDSGSEDGDEPCDLLEQDCAEGQACYPSADGMGGVCGTPHPQAGTSTCPEREDEECEEGWYCSRDHFGSCEQLCDLSLDGDDCLAPENLPDQDMRCTDPSIHPMPEGVGYCSIF